jgi:glucosamine--fructose-6-phosphate aminotransferase (isomerizing)
MCGIIGYIGGVHQAASVLLDGLSRLEYRGYDSAGLAVIGGNGIIQVEKAVGRLQALRQALDGRMPEGRVGIGHTRWATHGRPTLDNAHPHLDCRGEVAVVQNGIVENYLPLKRGLIQRGHRFTSQTDTEVLPHLIEEEMAQAIPLEEAVRRAVSQVEGAQAFLIASVREPETLVALRSGNAGGLVVGYGVGEMFIASDLPALLPHTRRVVYLAGGEGATLTPQGVRYWTLRGEPLQRRPQIMAQDPVSAAKEGYKHFMLKEIFQQPDVITDVIRGRVDLESPSLYLEELEGLAGRLKDVRRVVLMGCGTSLHAARSRGLFT